MSAQTVITHAPNQGEPMPVRGYVMVSTGTGALLQMDAREVLEFRARGIRPDVVTAPLGSAARLSELGDGAAYVRVCLRCGDTVPVVGPWDVSRAGGCDVCEAPPAPRLAYVPRPSGGVSLTKATDTVSRDRGAWVPSAMRSVDVGPVVGAAWWGVPAHVVSGWITRRLSRAEYADAAALSVLLHGRPVADDGGFVESV